MSQKDIQSKMLIIYAGFFGKSPFEIKENEDIQMQFGADEIDKKELMWIIGEEFEVDIQIDEITCVGAAVRAVVKQKM